MDTAVTTPDDENKAREAADRVTRDLDRMMEQMRKQMEARGTEMGRGKEIENPGKELLRPFGMNTSDGVPVVPREIDEARKLAELRERQERYNSKERRDAIQRNLERAGIDPNLRAIRELFEQGQGRPPEDIVKRHDRSLEAPERGRAERDASRETRGREQW